MKKEKAEKGRGAKEGRESERSYWL